MQTEDIKKFVDLLKDTDVEELQWESGGLKVSLKRSDMAEMVLKPSAEEKDAQEKDDAKKILSIKSPMVGTFYRAQSTDHPPLVIEGNHVVPGQKVAVIEAMRIMKDVVSSVKGKITKVLIENGQPVDYGRDLFIIDPENDEEKSGGK